MQYIQNHIEEKLSAINATYEKKHAALVESQRKVIEKYIDEALEKVHSNINAYASQSREFSIIIPGKELGPVQPETKELLESLSFRLDPYYDQWFADYHW